MNSILNKINTIVTVIGMASSAYEIMQRTFKWYEKKHQNKNKGISRPVVKGI